jgi:hypothetical protein
MTTTETDLKLSDGRTLHVYDAPPEGAAVEGQLSGAQVAADEQPAGAPSAASSPDTDAAARRRGSTRAKWPAIRPSSSSRVCCQRAVAALVRQSRPDQPDHEVRLEY